jgi:hypothetical protein
MAALFFYALTPSENNDLGTILSTFEASVLVQVYQIFGVLHAVSTLFLSYLCKRREIVSQLAPWLPVKLCLVICVSLLLPFDTAAAIFLSSLPTWTLPTARLISYTVFTLNTLYFALFYYDLKFVSIQFSYKSEIKEFKTLNESTF